MLLLSVSCQGLTITLIWRVLWQRASLVTVARAAVGTFARVERPTAWATVETQQENPSASTVGYL